MPRRKPDPDKDWINLPAVRPSETILQVRYLPHSDLVLLRSTVNRDDALAISEAEWDSLRAWFDPTGIDYQTQLQGAVHVAKLIDEFLADPSTGQVRSRPKK